MRCVNQSDTVRFFYKTDNLASGQNVIFNIWDGTGGVIVSNALPDAEVGTEGVYYIDVVAPDANTYLLTIASNDGLSPESQVVKVGNPSLKAWYVQGAFEGGRQIAYEIYDSTDTVLSSGFLTNVVSGFYYAETQGLAEPHFFEVYPWVLKNKPCT